MLDSTPVAPSKGAGMEAFKTKIGPLPAYGWVIIFGGLVVGFYLLKKRGGSTTLPVASTVTGTDPYSNGNYGSGSGGSAGGGGSTSPASPTMPIGGGDTPPDVPTSLPTTIPFDPVGPTPGAPVNNPGTPDPGYGVLHWLVNGQYVLVHIGELVPGTNQVWDGTHIPGALPTQSQPQPQTQPNPGIPSTYPQPSAGPQWPTPLIPFYVPPAGAVGTAPLHKGGLQ